MTNDDASAQNVVFVVMDTVRKDHLSVYGYDRPTTPGLERFAEDATVFEQAVAPAPWTLPVHASLFTGMYPSEHGASQENPYLEGATTLAQTLSAAGYGTACYSSNAWITPYTHLTDGFDDQDNFFEVMPGDFLSGPMAKAWKVMNDNEKLRAVADKLVSLGNVAHEYLASGEGADSKTPQVIDSTIEFIDDADGPYFTFINLMDAHLPYHPPKKYREQFAPGVDSTEVCQNSKEYNCGARDIDEDEWEDIRGLYDAEIRHIDDQLDRLFSWLKANDEWDDTMVVVCADHGELHGEHDLYGHEFCIYDPVINVPLLVKHPDLDPGVSDQQVELVDLYHTVLDHAGVSGSNSTRPLDEARSLLGADYRSFAEDVPGGGECAFVEYYRPVVELKQLEEKAKRANITLDEDSRFYSRMRAARRPDAKYIRNERIEDEFYHLDEDPGERRNARGEGSDEEVELEAALSAFEETVGGEWNEVGDEDVLGDMSDDAKDRLQDLGYID
ncbi:sulfatase [Haladaptatus salinisoli]|uniref:sulfatase n=1 Tax=Haladaptatus salinisoli TaxID=2884876 RepID=UPI001D0A155F|nr:sulfatase [Haladaptatus salinisoli]